ncbi:MAG: glycosyltransferase [Candidatus Scalindua sp.]
MKISIVDPHKHRGFNRYSKNIPYSIHGYMIEFIKKYKPNIYLTRKDSYSEVIDYFKDLKIETDRLNILLPSIFNRSLYRNTDVLIYINGWCGSDPAILRKFNGLKMFHIMDPQYHASELNEFLVNGGVDYLLGYNSYDKHSEFVRLMYPSFQDKIIRIPFGFAPKWKVITPFKERKSRAILAGTMETFEAVRKSDYYKKVIDYFHYFSPKYNSMHEIRYLIDRDISQYADYVDSKINHWPHNLFEDPTTCPDRKKNWTDNEEFNKYKFFINDESLLNFCPIRTYEGIAAGCVMLAHEATCYAEWGFEDNLNCIKFNRIEEIPERIEYYLKNEKLLYAIQENGIKFVKDNYNHVSVADVLYKNIYNAYSK